MEERRDDSKLWEKLNKIHTDVLIVKGDVKEVTNKVDEHETILRGQNKTNGLVSEVQSIKTTGSNFKWFAGLGGSAGFLGLISKYFGSGH